MLRDLKKEIFYPHPPQRVWQVLTNRHALAAWLMENDFEPRVGHKFRFLYSSMPGLGESIDCEVIELDEPKRLSFTWQDSMMYQPSIVTWTLKPVDGGTQLQLEHKGLRHKATKLVEPLHSTKTCQGQFRQEPKAVTQTLVPPAQIRVFPSIPAGRYEELDSIILSSYINGGWEYKLSEKLSQILETFVNKNYD